MTDRAADHSLLARTRLADVARAYYFDNRSKVEIAEQFGLSRFQVARMLDDARATGVVTIEIHDPRAPRSAREAELAALLGMEQVRIVEDGDDADVTLRERVGATVLGQLADAIRPGMTVGVSWSRTLDLAARFLSALPACTLVQLTGAFELPGGGTFTRLFMQLDRRGGVTTYPLYAPLVVDEPTTAQDLRRQPVVAEALDRASQLDIAVVAIGAWRAGESSVWDKVSPAVRDACTEAGSVAEFSGIFIDAHGAQVSTPLDGRTIAVGLDQLRRAGQVLGFAHSAERVDAVLAAVRSGVFSSLVIDGPLATALLSGRPAVRRDLR